MAFSGTYAFQSPGDYLLEEAWERCGKNPDVIDERVSTSAMRSLQLALIGWANKGTNIWQIDQVSVSVAIGANIFPTATSTIDLLELNVVEFGRETPLAAISREDYMAIPDKTIRSRPTQYWVEKILPSPIIHFYPAAIQAYTFRYNRIRQTQDFDELTQTPEIPVQWTEAMVAELAARLAVKYAPDRVQMLRQEADRTFSEAESRSGERVPFIMKPDGWA